MNINQHVEIKNHRKSKLDSISPVWFIPFLAFLIGCWMLWQYFNDVGTDITIILPTAEGVEVKKTAIKSLNVTVGMITDIRLSDDYTHILATAKINKNATRMLRDDTLFWVVKPRIDTAGISGLDTILSGAYIQLQPGKSEITRSEFVALDIPPVAPPDAQGLRIVLTHKSAGKLNQGDPVIYKGFTVGRVESIHFDIDKQKASYQLFIFAPYDKLVNTHSNFWVASGVDLQLNTQGFKLTFGSLESILIGGVAFETPENYNNPSILATHMTNFRLFDEYLQIDEVHYDEYIEYVMLFDESIRGLNVDAPVEYRGLPIGSVKRIPFKSKDQQERTSSYSIPVLIHIEPERLYNSFNIPNHITLKEFITQLFKEGLRASLTTGNLLTASLYIDLDFDKYSSPYNLATYSKIDVFPTKKSGLTEVQKQLSTFLHTVNSLPLEDTITNLNHTLASSTQTIDVTKDMITQLTSLLKNEQIELLPYEIKNMLQQLSQTLKSYNANSHIYEQIQQTLHATQNMMQEMQPILQQINDKPNSLIFGANKIIDPIPVRGQN